LALVAALMLFQSAHRLFSPSPIHYDEALVIAIIGLAVNLLCAWLLEGGDRPHDHADQWHNHEHSHTHADINLRSAYVHVLADAATSVLAILALLGGKFFGAAWLDPAMGVVGAILVGHWAQGLLRQSARVLLDAEMDHPIVQEIRDVIASEYPAAAISDLHIWRVGKNRYACILALVSALPITGSEVRRSLAVHDELSHVSIEIFSGH
jgi:cation diffusion facilitator family transporter